MLIGILSVLKAGCAYVPINPDDPIERIKYFIDDCQTPLLITQKKYKSKIRAISCIKLYIDEIDLNHEYNIKKNIVPSNLAYVIYTSGSTGKPKGVLVEHKHVVNRIYWQWHQLLFKQSDIILQKTQFSLCI